MRVRRLCFAGLVAALIAIGVPATAIASHNNDEHSNNARLIASMPLQGDLSPFPGQLTTANSDLAFWGDRAYSGHYNGFRIMDISDPGDPQVLTDFTCRGAQDDVSVWENQLLILSIDEPQVDSDDPNAVNGACTTAADAADREVETNFEGIRIFDVSDPTNPVLIKGVDTDCGSHTHTLVPDTDNGRLLVYVSSYPLRAGPICGPNTSGRDGEDNPLHEQISVVEIPLADPASAQVINEPKLAHPIYNISQIDPTATGFFDSVGCHDITVFLEIELAAAACMSNGQLWDISDPANPKTLPADGAQYVDRPEVEFWHSAAFTWDGEYVLFGDERIREGGCETPNTQGGRLYIYRNANFAGSQPVSTFMIGRDQEGEYCSSHLWNHLARTDNRYLIAEAWYNGGVDIVEFTNPLSPKEVAYYDVAHPPGDEGNWAAYWYRDNVFATDIERGDDVFTFRGHGIAAHTIDFAHENPQTQENLITPNARKAKRARRASARTRARARARAKQRRLLRSFKQVQGPAERSVVESLTP